MSKEIEAYNENVDYRSKFYVGMETKGYAGGYFGSSYFGRHIEIIGADYLLCRSIDGEPEFCHLHDNVRWYGLWWAIEQNKKEEGES